MTPVKGSFNTKGIKTYRLRITDVEKAQGVWGGVERFLLIKSFFCIFLCVYNTFGYINLFIISYPLASSYQVPILLPSILPPFLLLSILPPSLPGLLCDLLGLPRATRMGTGVKLHWSTGNTSVYITKVNDFLSTNTL